MCSLAVLLLGISTVEIRSLELIIPKIVQDTYTGLVEETGKMTISLRIQVTLSMSSIRGLDGAWKVIFWL